MINQNIKYRLEYHSVQGFHLMGEDDIKYKTQENKFGWQTISDNEEAELLTNFTRFYDAMCSNDIDNKDINHIKTEFELFKQDYK